MADRAERRLAGCSHGMRQRIKLAQALVHDPWLLLLDEPLSGIDPGGRREINELLVRLAAQGKTILVSSHILVEIEQLASFDRDDVAGPDRGLRHAGRGAQLDALPPAGRRDRRRAGRAGWRRCWPKMPDVQGIEVREQSLTVRTRNPEQFFAHGRRAGLRARQSKCAGMQTLDAGADAVFDYLQQGRP